MERRRPSAKRGRSAVATMVAAAAVVAVALGRADDVAAATGVVARYGADFTLTGPAKEGWSYRWNAAGPIEVSPNVLNAAALAPLVRDAGGAFESAADGSYPDPLPGGTVAATATSLVPGQAASEASDGVSRWALASYTVSLEDVRAHGNWGLMETYRFAVPASSADGVTARLYVNEARILQSPLPGDFVYDQGSPGAYPVPFGVLRAGDVVTIALGAGFGSAGDRLDLDFEITLDHDPRGADLNGDGRVDAADYYRIDRGRALGLGGFENGDLDGNGVVDGDDVLMMDRAFLDPRNGALWTGGPSAGDPARPGATVPEPTAMTIALASFVGVALRRRRRRAR